jgi:collagenase-like protein with putative collagen-binding domain
MPHENAEVHGYEGWAYCARTGDKQIFLAYFEKGAPRGQVRGALLNAEYRAAWFDPRKGTWQDAGVLRTSATGTAELPEAPGDADWGLKLVAVR